MKKLLFFFLILQNLYFTSLYAQSQFVGTFSNEYFTFVFNSEQQKLVGNISASEGNFALEASMIGNNSISGTYDYYGQKIPFTGYLQQSQLIIQSEGQQFSLDRQQTRQSQKSNFSTTNNNLQKEPSWGIAFATPAGWTTQLAEGMRFFISQDQKNIIMLGIDTESSSLQDLQNIVSQGLVNGNIMLTSKGGINNFGNDGVATQISGTFNGKQTKGYTICRLSPYQNNAIIIGIGETADYSISFQQEIIDFAKNIQFFKPVKVSNISSDNNTGISDWSTYMKGRKLVYMKSDTGFYMKISIYLCSDGSFRYADNSGGFGNGASIAANAGYTGRWQASGKGNIGELILNYNDGSTKTYKTEIRDDSLYLNGRRYFRDTNDLCN